MKFLKYIALLSNLLFILWTLYNGMDEGFRGATLPEIVSYVGLAALLVINSVLLLKKGK